MKKHPISELRAFLKDPNNEGMLVGLGVVPNKRLFVVKDGILTEGEKESLSSGKVFYVYDLSEFEKSVKGKDSMMPLLLNTSKGEASYYLWVPGLS